MYTVKNTSEFCTYLLALLLSVGANYAVRFAREAVSVSENRLFYQLYFPITLAMVSLRVMNESLEFFDQGFLSCYQAGYLNCSQQTNSDIISGPMLPMLSPNSNLSFFETPTLSNLLFNLKRKAIYPLTIAIATCCELFLIPKQFQNTQVGLLVLSIIPAVLYLTLHKLMDLSERCAGQSQYQPVLQV